jgi:hypothetical protein
VLTIGVWLGHRVEEGGSRLLERMHPSKWDNDRELLSVPIPIPATIHGTKPWESPPSVSRWSSLATKSRLWKSCLSIH